MTEPKKTDPEVVAAERASLVAASELAAKEMAERRARAQDRELARLVEFNGLVKRFSAEKGEANLGRTWEIVDSLEGFFVVTRLPPAVMSQWEQTVTKAQKAGQDVPTISETLGIVLLGLLHPDPDTFRKWVNGDAATSGAEAIARLSMNVITKLHGNYLGDMRSKI
jgi:hypothetical protein